jgi:hypothetical protein
MQCGAAVFIPMRSFADAQSNAPNLELEIPICGHIFVISYANLYMI